MTKRGQFRFVVKDGADGDSWWIVGEPAGDILPGVERGMGFELRRGLTEKEVKSFAAMLNSLIVNVVLI